MTDMSIMFVDVFCLTCPCIHWLGSACNEHKKNRRDASVC